MGGGGYDHQDVEEARERRALSHRCTSVADQIKECRYVDDLHKWAKLISIRIKKLEADSQAEKERVKRQEAFDKDLAAVSAALRTKHGLK